MDTIGYNSRTNQYLCVMFNPIILEYVILDNNKNNHDLVN